MLPWCGPRIRIERVAPRAPTTSKTRRHIPAGEDLRCNAAARKACGSTTTRSPPPDLFMSGAQGATAPMEVDAGACTCGGRGRRRLRMSSGVRMPLHRRARLRYGRTLHRAPTPRRPQQQSNTTPSGGRAQVGSSRPAHTAGAQATPWCSQRDLAPRAAHTTMPIARVEPRRGGSAATTLAAGAGSRRIGRQGSREKHTLGQTRM